MSKYQVIETNQYIIFNCEEIWEVRCLLSVRDCRYSGDNYSLNVRIINFIILLLK